MFAAVFFEHDGNIEVVALQKIKRDKTREGHDLELNEEVAVPFRTIIIDDAGREKEDDVDYTGKIIYINKDRPTLKRYVHLTKGDSTFPSYGDITREKLQKAAGNFENSDTTAKRKHKKTSKFQQFEEENLEVPKTPTKRQNDDVRSEVLDDSPAKSTRSKKRSKQVTTVSTEPDKQQTRKTGANDGKMISETQKLQALQYFQRKKSTTQSVEKPVPEPEAGPSNTISDDQIGRREATVDVEPFDTVLPPMVKENDHQLPHVLAVSSGSSQHFETFTKDCSITELPSSSRKDHNETYTQVYEDVPFSSAIGQGYQTLWGPPPMTKCRECDLKLEENDSLKRTIHELQNENHFLKENKRRIINKLKQILTDEKEPETIYIFDNVESTEASQNLQVPSFLRPSSENIPNASLKASSTLVSPRASTSAPSGAASVGIAQIDSLESMEQFEQFFKPGDEKIKLMEGHGLYIETVKLQAIRSKAKKEPKKVIRDLLSYYFTEEYLSRHSSTGMKSSLKGLPSEIMVPMKDYMAKQYHVHEPTFNETVNRKCRDLTKKLLKSSK